MKRKVPQSVASNLRPNSSSELPGAEPAPPIPAIVAEAFERMSLRRRARMLGRLLASVGPLALAVVGGGAFAKYVAQARWQEIPVSLDDAARATSSQVSDVVRYVQQSNPQVFAQLLDVLARDTTTIAALGASVAALTISRLSSRRADGKARRTPVKATPPGTRADDT